MDDFEKAVRLYKRNVIDIRDFFLDACKHATKENVEQIYSQISDDDRIEFYREVAYQKLEAEVFNMGTGKVTRLDKFFYKGLSAFREYFGTFQFGDYLLMEKLRIDNKLSSLHLCGETIDQAKARDEYMVEKSLIERLLETHEPVVLKQIKRGHSQ